MVLSDSLPRSTTEWSVQKAAETIRMWQRLIPWGLAAIKVSGTHIFHQGSAPRGIFLLERGLVKLNCTLRDGQGILVSLRLPGQLVDGTCVHWLGESYPVSAVAATECRVCHVSAEAMLLALRQNPDVAQFLLQQQCLDVYNQAIALVEGKILNAPERFAQLLRHLATVLGLNGGRRPVRLELPFSNTEIASLLGVTRNTSAVSKNNFRKKAASAGKVVQSLFPTALSILRVESLGKIIHVY